MSRVDRHIYLASRSPRRRELLKQIGIGFELLLFREDSKRGVDLDERPLEHESAGEYVIRVARAKADMAWQRVADRRLFRRPVLAADTTVALGNDIFGKPADRDEAAEMLNRLAGRTHQVLTAVAVCREDILHTALSVSEVEFKPLSEQEIRHYVASGEPLDKAGAYAVQGRAAAFIQRLAGSYSGVMGLPLYETAELLHKFGIEP